MLYHATRCVAEFEGNNLKNPLSLVGCGTGDAMEMQGTLTAEKAAYGLIRMVGS